MKQLIFVVETNKNAQTDDRYITRLIQDRYDLSSNEYMYNFVHMSGKSNYNKDSVVQQIRKYVKDNKEGENNVIYCFDTDKIDTSNEAVSCFDNEKKYCEICKYEMIWFYYNIEFVLLGRIVEESKKKQESINYYKMKTIDYNIQKLSQSREIKGCSNIFSVLDRHLPVKQNKF